MTGPAAEPFVFTACTAASFQLPSVKTRGSVVSSQTAATEEVRITRFRVLPCFKAEFRSDVVPRTAGMMRSVVRFLSVKGEYSEKIGRTVRVGRLEVEWRGNVGDGVDAFDRLVKCTVLGDILDNDELKPVAVMDKFIVEEGAFGQ